MESADKSFALDYLASTETHALVNTILRTVVLDHHANCPLLVNFEFVVCNVSPARRHTGHREQLSGTIA